MGDMPKIWIGVFTVSILLFLVVYLWAVFRHKEKVKFLEAASWIALGIAFFMVLHIIGLMIFPIKIQEIDLPMKILNPNYQVRRGEPLTLQYHIVKYVQLPSTVYPAFLCDGGYYATFPERVSNVPVGEGTYTVKTNYVIPADAPSDTCHISSTDVFQINVLRKKTYFLTSEDFTIID